jgi:hypothetical protein
MKLSDLSKRDYIAIEVVGHFVANPFFDAKKMTECAYTLADAMIAHAGAPARDHELEELRASTASLQRSNEVLRNLVPHTERAATIALEQIWEFLGVNNQTAAMQMLRDAFPELGK